MSSTLGVRHQQTRWFPPPLGRLGAGPVAVEAAAGVIQGAEDRLEVSKMASRENGGEFGVAFVGDVEDEEDEEEGSDVGREDGEGVVRRTFRFVLPESPTDDGDGGEDEEEEEGCWSEDRSPRVGRSAAASSIASEDDGARPEEGDDTPSTHRPRRPCSVVLDPIPSDLLRSLSSVGRISSERASLRSTPPPLADCDEPPRPLPPLHPQPRARPIAVVDPSCEGPRRRLSAPAIAGGPPTPPGGAAPLLAGAPLRHRRCSCHGAGAHGARSPRPAIDPPTLPPRRHGGAWASRDVMTTSDPDVEVLVVAEEEARGGGRECMEEGAREEGRRNVGEEEEVRRAVRKRERAKRRRRRREEEDEEGGRSSGETEREIRSVERNNYRKRSCSSSTTASSSTTSSTSTAFSSRRRHKHRKRRRRRARPLESEEEIVPLASEVAEEPCNANPTPRVNPIFVWAKQDDAATILEVLCEDYDKRNRIRLTKTPNGWRAIPRTERLAAATAISSVGQSPKEAPAGECATASNVEGPPDPSVLLRLPSATTVTPPPRRRSRGGHAKEKAKKDKGTKAIPRVAAAPEESTPHEDHDSPGQPETYGGEGPGRPETNAKSGTSTAPEDKPTAPKPKQVKPRDQRLINKRVKKAPAKRAKPKKKPVVKKVPAPAPIVTDIPPLEEKTKISKENEEQKEVREVPIPKREPVKKAAPRNRRKTARVTRATTRSRARVNNPARRIRATKAPVVPPTPLQSPPMVLEADTEEVEGMSKEEEEIKKVEAPEQPEVEGTGERAIEKETVTAEYESGEEVPAEETAEVGEEMAVDAVVVEEAEEDPSIIEDASGEVEEPEAVGREDVEEIMDEEEAVAEESGAITEVLEEVGSLDEEADAESHAEALVEEDIEEVEATADNEEVNEAEMVTEENPEGEEALEGAEGVTGEGDVEGEILEEGVNEEEVDGEMAAQVEMEGETTMVEEGEAIAMEEGEVAQVEEGDGEEEAPIGEEEEGELGEAIEEEEADEEDDEEDDEDEDDEEEDEEEEESPPKTPPPAHAASNPTLLIPQATEGEGLQEEAADLSIQKQKSDEVDEAPPFKKVRRSHVTGLPPSTRITTCPRSMLPPKEAPPTNVDPSVPAPAHSLEPYQPIAPTMNEERPTESKTPQKDPLDLVFPVSEESAKAQELLHSKEQWRKVSSSEGAVRENSEPKGDANSSWGENLSLEPPLKKIKVEIEEEEPISEMMEPNVEDSHQITLKKLLNCSKEGSPNPGLTTSVDIVVPKPKVELVFPADVIDASGKSCARSRLLELLTSPDAHKSSPSPNRSTPVQRTPSPATPIVNTRPYSHPTPAVKLEPRTEEADGGCEEGKAGLELKRLKDLLGRQSAAKLALKPIAMENPTPLTLKQVVNPPETTISRLPTPERQQSESLPSQRTPPVTSRAEPVRVPQPSVRNNKQSKTSHQSSFPHNRTASRGSAGREANASRSDGSSGTDQDAATAAAAAALHNMLWLPYLGQLEMAVNTGNRELLASLGNAMFGPPPPVSPSSQSSASPRALSHFPTPPPPQNPPFVHGTPFLHPTSLPPSAIADYKSRVELSQTLNLWQDIMAANASSAFNTAHQDLLTQESLERNGGTNGLIGCQRQDGNINSHMQERQSPRFPHNGRKPSPVSTPLSPSHSPSADFLRYINSGVFSGSSNSIPRSQIPQNNNQYNVCYNGVHNSNAVHNSSKHSFNEQKVPPMRHPTPSQIYRNIETNSNQLQHTLSLTSLPRPRKSPTTSVADSTQSKNSIRRQSLSSPRDETVKIPVSSSMPNASQRQKPALTCRSLLNLLSNPQPDGVESNAADNMADESARMDQQRHGHLLAALARPSSSQTDKRSVNMSRFPPIPSSMCPQVIGLDSESEYLQSARFSAPLSGVTQTLLPAGVQPMDLSGRSGGKPSKREERAAEIEAFRSQEMAASLNTANGSAHPHLWHPLFGSQKTCDPWRWRTVAVNGD